MRQMTAFRCAPFLIMVLLSLTVVLGGCFATRTGGGSSGDATGDGPATTDGDAPAEDPGPTPDGADTPDPPDVPGTTDLLDDVDTSAGTVKSLQAYAEGVGCDEGQIATIVEQVALSEVVVASPKYDAYTPDDAESTALDGYFVADADGGLWSGIVVVIDRADGTDFQVGDRMDLEGQLEEAWCMTQLRVSSWSKLDLPWSAAVVPLLEASEVGAEPYEGMVVSVSSAKVIEELGFGSVEVEGGLVIGDLFDLYAGLETGKTYDITGVVITSYGTYTLNPRTLDDIVPHEEPTPTDTVSIVALQSGAASTGCVEEIVNVPGDIIVEGTVIVPSFSVHATLAGYILSDGTQDPYSAVLIVVPVGDDQDWSVGDLLRISGEQVEFYCLTQVKASSVEVLEETGEGVSALAMPDLGQTDLEPWESLLVSTGDLTVSNDSDWDDKGFVKVQRSDGTDAGFLVDNWIAGDGLDKPVVGTSWSQVTGIVRYSYGAYRLSPRSPGDLTAE